MAESIQSNINTNSNVNESNEDKFSIKVHESEHISLPVEGVLTSGIGSDLGATGPQISTSTANRDFEPSTIDEPVKDTILRDAKAIGLKFYRVFVPRSSRTLLRDWDLWGPLILCTVLALVLQGQHSSSSSSHDGGPQFAQVFIIYWVGAAVVTLNAQLLSQSGSDKNSAKTSPPGFLQSVCVLGYCVLPLLLALIISKLVGLVISSSSLGVFLLRCLSTAAGLVWSVFAASTAFLPAAEVEQQQQQQQQQPRDLFAKRKILVAYPICLFYLVLAWLVLAGSA